MINPFEMKWIYASLWKAAWWVKTLTHGTELVRVVIAHHESPLLTLMAEQH